MLLIEMKFLECFEWLFSNPWNVRMARRTVWGKSPSDSASLPSSGGWTIGQSSCPRGLRDFFQVYGDFGGGMKIDSGLIVLLAIVTALVIVALALLFYSPGNVCRFLVPCNLEELSYMIFAKFHLIYCGEGRFGTKPWRKPWQGRKNLPFYSPAM